MGSAAAAAADALPKSLDPRLEIQLFAESPQIVTPTDLDVDHLGRVWAIESNTHFPPTGYTGHSSDRVLVFHDDNHDGKADRIEIFADGFVHAMSLAVRFSDGVYVATRKEVFHLADTDGDGKADRRRVILRLDTAGDYPHNGLAGFAFDGLGFLYIGLGENLGAAYRLIGTDGRTLSGGGEGGSLFRCRPDGSDLTLWATGFWNPHASCFDAFGRMFTVDNDPDDRPPCRMLHIIPGGDYGYRFRNGRRGIHPFTAWDGELPGTLPMVSGTGEAPCGIVAYESNAFPGEYRGNLFVTSWGDHRIDRFRVRPQGISLTSRAEPLIVGGENFRPVGLALAPDGSLFATDWVLKDYKVHGHGRIWRIAPKGARRPTKADDLAAVPHLPLAQLRQKLDSPRLDVRRLAAQTLADRDRPFLEAVALDQKSLPRRRLEASWAVTRRSERASSHPPLRSSLKNAEIPLLWPDLERGGADRSGTALLERLRHPTAVNPSIELLRLVSGFDKFLSKEPAFLEKVATIDDRFVFAAVVQALTGRWNSAEFAGRLLPETNAVAPRTACALLAARQTGPRKFANPVLSTALRDPDFSVRRTAIQWVGEERLSQFRRRSSSSFPIRPRPRNSSRRHSPRWRCSTAEARLEGRILRCGLRLAAGARRTRGRHGPRIGLADGAARSQGARFQIVEATAGRANSACCALRPPARCARRHSRKLPQLLRSLASDQSAERRLRFEAIAGLGGLLQRNDRDPATLGVLRPLARRLRPRLSNRGPAGLAAIRSAIRRFKPTSRRSPIRCPRWRLCPAANWSTNWCWHFGHRVSQFPSRSRRWPRRGQRARKTGFALAVSGGDAEAGRRVFEHPNSGGCFHCHTVNGRGGKIGPELSVIARSANRGKLAESILRPSKEIAPQFASWTFVTREGRTVVGTIVDEDREGHSALGRPREPCWSLPPRRSRNAIRKIRSVMPERLVDAMTPGEFRDLIAFLASLK